MTSDSDANKPLKWLALFMAIAAALLLMAILSGCSTAGALPMVPVQYSMAGMATPDPVLLAGFLACAFFLAGGVNQVLKLLDRNKEQPPPGETYTTIKECRAMHSGQDARINRVECQVQTMRDEIKGEILEMTRLDEGRTAGLHERINKVLESVSELRGEIRRMHK